jgi:hypothetical protein
MTEEQWLAGTDPTGMLAFLQLRCLFSGRMATLLMAGACRQLPDLLANEGSRLAVEAAEAVADGGKPSRPPAWARPPRPRMPCHRSHSGQGVKPLPVVATQCGPSACS